MRVRGSLITAGSRAPIVRTRVTRVVSPYITRDVEQYFRSYVFVVYFTRTAAFLTKIASL